MPSSSLFRWSGLAALVGGLLFAVGDVSSFVFFGTMADLAAVSTQSQWVPVMAGLLVSQFLVLLGLVGIYARQSGQAGVLGLVGFVLAFVGMALLAGFMWTNLFVVPTLGQEAPEILVGDPEGGVFLGIVLSLFSAALGWIVFGIATLRAKVLPRGAAIVLLLGGVVSALPVPFGPGLVLGAGLAWAGYWLWSEKGAMRLA